MDWLQRCNPQIHVVGVTRQRLPWRDALRTLHDHELLFFAPGFSGAISWNSGTARISGSDWALIPPGLPHTCQGSGPGSPWRAWVHFDWDYYDETVPRLLTYAPAVVPASQLRLPPAWVPLRGVVQGAIVAFPALRDLHARLVVAWRHGGRPERIAARGLLLELLAVLFAGEAGTERDPRQVLALTVRDVLDHIAAQPFATSEALRTALARLGRSPDHCARAFRAVFGISPARYLAAQRTRQAEELLGEGMPAVEVARALGFTDPGYFNRMFRRQAGCAPGHWRRRQLEHPL
jgi:AraC-like DNA-binding protein